MAVVEEFVPCPALEVAVEESPVVFVEAVADWALSFAVALTLVFVFVTPFMPTVVVVVSKTTLASIGS